jgi:hypothetical protein
MSLKFKNFDPTLGHTKYHMRKLLFVLVVSLVANSSFGQVRLGLKAGVNAATVADNEWTKTRFGINAGPIAQINIGKMFFVQSELLYSLKGFKYEYEDSTWSDHATISLHYINLPVLLGFKPGKNFSIKLGPEIGRLLSARNETAKIDISNIYYDFDFGADLGLSYSFKNLAFDLRYNYGIKKVINLLRTDAWGNPFGEKGFGKNRTLQLSLYYLIK